MVFYKNIKTTFFWGCSIGLLCFLAIWGWKLINIFNINWAIWQPDRGDARFPAIAMIDFCHEPWQFPVGIIKNLIYPNQTSIIYADAIPLFALVFKLITPFISANFQYIGIWGVFCFCLQGGFAAIILRRYTNSVFVTTITSIFFILSPFICGRMFGHISLSGQWIILLALALVWHRNSSFICRHEYFVWIVTCILSTLVNAYFTAMVYSIFIIYSWCRVLESKSKVYVVQKMFLLFLYSGVGCALTFWLCGGFLAYIEPCNMDYGIAPFNLNAFINPQWASLIIKPLEHGSPSNEGYAWLGLGIIIGLIFCFINKLEAGFPNKTSIIHSLPFVIISLILICYAATNRIMFGNKLLVDISLPPILLKLCSAFRSSARFVWPVYYMIYIWVLGNLLARYSRKRIGIIIISLLLFIQILDFSPWLRYASHNADLSYKKTLMSSFWEKLSPVYHHIYFVPFSGSVSTNINKWAEIAWFAVNNKLTLNVFALGRIPLHKMDRSDKQKIEELSEGKLNGDDIIIVNRMCILQHVQFKENIGLYYIDNLFILLNRPQVELAQFPDIRKVEYNKGSLAEYLMRLKKEKSDKLIILTARDANPIKFDGTTEGAFRQLGFHTNNLSNKPRYAFIGIIEPVKKVFYEEISCSSLAINNKKDDFLGLKSLGVDVDFSINPTNLGEFPKIFINGIDYSQQYLGLNICVYDLKHKKIEELANFDLFTMAQGDWITFKE